MLKKLLLNSVQHWLNRLLQLDAASTSKLQALNGKLFLLRCTRPTLDFYIHIENNTVCLLNFTHTHASQQKHSKENASHINDTQQTANDKPNITDCVPDTTLEGGASALLKLMQASNPVAALSAKDISLRGDHAAFEKFLNIFKTLEADFEAPLADIIGDVAAHGIGKTLRGIKKVVASAARNFKRHFEEYVLHEAKLSPHATEIDHWQQQVQHLKQNTERLAAKINKLQHSL